MENELNELNEQLMSAVSRSNAKIAITITGGGTAAIGEILRYGGLSGTVFYAHVPYSPIFTEKYLGHFNMPDKLCSPEAARMLAMKAFHDVNQECGEEDFPVGIGSTSALGKITKEREGREHKMFVAIQNRQRTMTFTLFLTTPRSRVDEEKINEELILLALAYGCNLPANMNEFNQTFLDGCETAEVQIDDGGTLEPVLSGDVAASFYVQNKGIQCSPDPEHVKLMLPGSFNPIHDAHREMARIASEMTGELCHFEMSIVNADKPPLDYTEIYRRLDIFDTTAGELWLTRLPTFVEKAEYFAPVTFVVGADTVSRICNPRFYGDSEDSMQCALQKMFNLGTKFICFARKMGWTEMVTQKALSSDPPAIFKKMATAVDPNVFASELSSREIRRNGG